MPGCRTDAKLALRFLALTAARSAEVRGETWDGIALGCAMWTVPSERMKASSPRATRHGHLSKRLYFSGVSESERRCGAAMLPTGRRREALFANIEGMHKRALGDRVLPFDREAARVYGDVASKRRSAGRPSDPVDCLIAATARSRAAWPWRCGT